MSRRRPGPPVPQAKPRNPYVVRARLRAAGPHAKPVKVQRQHLKHALRRALEEPDRQS